MRVTIDGSEVACNLSGITNIEELMDGLYRRAAAGGRVVYRVELNGKELTPGAEQEIAAVPLAEVLDLSLTTNSPAELLRNGLEGSIALCNAICADTAKAVDAFRMGDGETGQSYYLACVESMGTFFHLAGAILDGIRSGYFPAGQHPDTSVPAPSSETAEILVRLLEDQKRGDWTAMADELEFEVVPNLRVWGTYLAGLKAGQAK